MLLSTAIDFYIDDQNQAIPASMAASYILTEEDLIVEQQLPEISHPQFEPVVESKSTFPWLTAAATAASAVSLGMFWLSNQSGSTFPFAPANAQIAGVNTLSAVQAPGLATAKPVRAAVAAPETTAKPIFSKAIQANRLAQPVRGEFLQQAQRFSSRALALAQTAQSVDDWRFVSSQWQRAVTVLASVPRGHADHAAAQQQLAQYRPLLQQVQRKAQQRIVEAPLPMTTVYSPELEKAKQEAEQQATQNAVTTSAATPGTAQPPNPAMAQPGTGQAPAPQ